MTPSPTQQTNAVIIQHHASVSAPDILNIINSVLQADTPLIIQTLPPASGAATTVTTVIGLSELGLTLAGQIAGLIGVLHQKKQAAPVTSLDTVTIAP